MICVDDVKKRVRKIEIKIDKVLEKKKYEDALALISICAKALYTTNICYMDNNLETAILKIAKETKINPFADVASYRAERDTLLFYDGFGINDRGLIQIYLKALCKVKKVIYVTYEDRKDLIPDVQDILDAYGCEKRYLKRRKIAYMDLIKQLNKVVKEFRPSKMFFYSVPDDVVATSIMYAYDGFITRYQVNLTDHAFWLGAKCLDRCIEFRDYGAKISNEYREIPISKITVVPFYPIIHREKKFQGYPFEVKEGKKVIFSGGSLYKTLGGNNKYYEIVDHILQKHNNVIFWYAGSGDDSEIQKIISKYPGRAYLTEERSDLLQILEHSRLYLSTYPMCGGLMFQYAAIAGCVPVTLKSGNISDGFLINQDLINIEFTSIDLLYEEIDKLLNDDNYLNERAKVMKKSVIKPELFDEEVRKVVEDGDDGSFKVAYGHVDTEAFRNWYLDGLNKFDLDAIFVRKNTVKLGIIYYPFIFIRGSIQIAKKILKKHLL